MLNLSKTRNICSQRGNCACKEDALGFLRCFPVWTWPCRQHTSDHISWCLVSDSWLVRVSSTILMSYWSPPDALASILLQECCHTRCFSRGPSTGHRLNCQKYTHSLFLLFCSSLCFWTYFQIAISGLIFLECWECLVDVSMLRRSRSQYRWTKQTYSKYYDR